MQPTRPDSTSRTAGNEREQEHGQGRKSQVRTNNGEATQQAQSHDSGGVTAHRQENRGGNGRVTRGRFEDMDRESLMKEIRKLRRGYKDAHQKLEEVTGQVGGLQRSLAEAENKLTVTATLLDERTATLRATETLLTKNDQYSDADVLRLVNELNDHILQASAQIADARIRLSPQTSRHQGDIDEAKQRIESSVGAKMVQLLQSRLHDRPSVLQMAFQACIVFCASRIIKAWVFQHFGDRKIFDEVHKRIHANGEWYRSDKGRKTLSLKGD
ncbi:predicted protein [Postia placenta Mad-698-R]|uniref:Uncharacterized protein n=1 Tax=Postia placenta MAD-698-R-SB12 TaxID=670580 RepID=A0A1X6MZR3_9APHY|nr:hypothetical protein POSPLADRAFT_1144810 [Postia placenta MAD-698-R-SB12]EED79475.1 predicted protein [Postia placenta Mad-698-R]OSX61861.1 hypothetical protein POSPLADRAFT_1144810 [Postia placenta MAD-698-R-SB12]